jgi:hypothetical protein
MDNILPHRQYVVNSTRCRHWRVQHTSIRQMVSSAKGWRRGRSPGVACFISTRANSGICLRVNPCAAACSQADHNAGGPTWAGREPAGEASTPSVRTALGCVYSEVMAVTPSQMEETAVSRVECPECLAIREIHPKGETVKLPWHPETSHTHPTSWSTLGEARKQLGPLRMSKRNEWSPSRGVFWRIEGKGDESFA